MKKSLLFLALLACLMSTLVKAQAGAPDPAFGGGDGFVLSSFLTGGHAYPNAIAVQANGRIVVAGSTWIPNGDNSQMALARYLPNGNPDVTFDGDGKLQVALPNLGVSANAVAIQPDGKILIAGNAWTDQAGFLLLARFLADGTPDPSFDGDGFVTTSLTDYAQNIVAMALQPDGKIVVAGYANLSGYDEFAVLRYQTNGQPDPGFGGGDGFVTTPVGDANAGASAVLIQPNGRIVAVGYAETNGSEDFAVVRYQANGIPDPFFSGDGRATASLSAQHDRAYDAQLQPDGKIVLVGYAGATGSGPADTEFAVARFTTGGTLDDTFSGDGLTTLHVSGYADGALTSALQADGKILLGGYAHSNAPGAGDFALMRLTTTGLPDNSFGINGLSTLATSPSSESMQAMTIQSDGKIVTTGTAWFDSRHSFAVARFLSGVTVAASTPSVEAHDLSVYPNPLREQATLRYTLAESATVGIQLYDLQGRWLQTLRPAREQGAGEQQMLLQFDNSLPAGTYWLSLETARGRAGVKVVLR